MVYMHRRMWPTDARTRTLFEGELKQALSKQMHFVLAIEAPGLAHIVGRTCGPHSWLRTHIGTEFGVLLKETLPELRGMYKTIATPLLEHPWRAGCLQELADDVVSCVWAEQAPRASSFDWITMLYASCFTHTVHSKQEVTGNLRHNCETVPVKLLSHSSCWSGSGSRGDSALGGPSIPMSSQSTCASSADSSEPHRYLKPCCTGRFTEPRQAMTRPEHWHNATQTKLLSAQRDMVNRQREMLKMKRSAQHREALSEPAAAVTEPESDEPSVHEQRPGDPPASGGTIGGSVPPLLQTILSPPERRSLPVPVTPPPPLPPGKKTCKDGIQAARAPGSSRALSSVMPPERPPPAVQRLHAGDVQGSAGRRFTLHKRFCDRLVFVSEGNV